MFVPLRAAVCRAIVSRVRLPSRSLATHALDKFNPILHDFTAELTQHQPKFSVPADRIHILSQPSEFYSMLLDMIRSAENRIFLSSLYIGSSETELISILMNRLAEKESLHLHILLDLNRSTRPGSSSTATTLLPLLRAFPDRVHVSLFRSPSLRGIMAKIVPPRFNEGWGTWHAKIYGVDDELIISGANLNKEYFTNRKDRYIRFAAQTQLSNYCFNFLREISKFSYRLLPADDKKLKNLNRHSYNCGEYAVVWPDSETHPHHITEKVNQAVTSFQESYRTEQGDTAPTTSDIHIFPIIQAGQFRIREEERFFQLLFGHLKKSAVRAILPAVGSLPVAFSSIPQERPLMHLTSGYFSLYKPYQDLILGTPQVGVCIVAASPKANGFFGSKGISGRIPEGYTYLEQRFMKAVRMTAGMFTRMAVGVGLDPNVELSEWEKDGWTYHAKGLWLSPSKDSSPVLSLIGSTNLNSRSADIDTELSFAMILPPYRTNGAGTDPVAALGDKLSREVADIRADVKEWKGDQRKVRWITKVLVFLIGNKL